MRLWLSILFMAFASLSAWQAEAQVPQSYPEEIEQKAREVGKQLRCVVCQNQSIEESDAELAADMRFVVRERLNAGDSKDQVIAQMRDRYGDYVLLKPPVQSNTIILWLGPLIGVILCLLWWLVASKKGAADEPVLSLSEAEKERLETLRLQMKDKSQ